MKKKIPFTKSYDIKQMKLSTIDNLVYAALHTYRNNKTFKCNPTMNQLADKLNLGTKAIKTSIDKLAELKYITIEQRTKGNKTNNYYHLPNIINFTKIPVSFIESDLYDAKLKGYTIAFRNLFFTDSLKCKYNNNEIAYLLDMTKRTSDKYIKQMIELNLITFNDETYTLNDAIVNWRLEQLEKDVKEIKHNVQANQDEINTLKSELELMKAKDEQRDLEMQQLKAMLYRQMKGTSKKNRNVETITL